MFNIHLKYKDCIYIYKYIYTALENGVKEKAEIQYR